MIDLILKASLLLFMVVIALSLVRVIKGILARSCDCARYNWREFNIGDCHYFYCAKDESFFRGDFDFRDFSLYRDDCLLEIY